MARLLLATAYGPKVEMAGREPVFVTGFARICRDRGPVAVVHTDECVPELAGGSEERN